VARRESERTGGDPGGPLTGAWKGSILPRLMDRKQLLLSSGAVFGSLERRVMDIVWDRGESSVRDVHAALGDSLAYTTVMTTLDRLFRKSVLGRRKLGRAFLYAAAAPREELERSALAELVRGLVALGPLASQPVLSSLVEALGNRDRLLLDELEQIVREKRRELRRKGDR
jgi:predicted transcriptional regulator